MLSIFGMILFAGGIGGIGCAVWMFMSNNGGPLYWLSILIGLVCIPITALGYVLMDEKERQEKAKGMTHNKRRQAVRNEFVRTVATVFGVILLGISIVALICAIGIAVFGGNTGPVDPMQVAFPLAALSILVGIPLGVFLLIWGFKKRR